MRRESYLCAACREKPATNCDHFFGRAKVPEALPNVWMLCLGCDADKTANRPSRIHWLQVFARHACIHGYVYEQRKALDTVEYLRAKFRKVP
jgi:hypothetical protein